MNKYLFLLALFLVRGLSAVDVDGSVVFVHIGDSIPAYLKCAIEQVYQFNPDLDVYLIANEKAYKKQQKDLEEGGLDPIAAIFVSCESLSTSKEHDQFNKQSKLDKRFRGGFWRYATERFFYLAELMSEYHLVNVIHLESDVMLYIELGETIPLFSTYYSGIAVTFDNDDRVIPGFVYIRDYNSIFHLTQFLVEKAQLGKNDMANLAAFKGVEKGKYIDHLPIIFPEYAEFYSLVSTKGNRSSNEKLFSNHYDAFLSIFDGAALGQYLGGIDPSHNLSRPGFINESCLFNPSRLTFVWEEDSLGRKVPFAVFPGKKIRINNLHIHSKALEKFRS